MSENHKWDDERILEEGESVSLLNNCRKKVKDFLNHSKIEFTIKAAVIVFCSLILIEVSISDYIGDDGPVTEVFRYINMIFLLFFVIEIMLWLFAEALQYFNCINIFDIMVVASALTLNILKIDIRIIGIFRVLRLIKGKLTILMSWLMVVYN